MLGVLAVLGFSAVLAAQARTDVISVKSPDGHITFEIWTDESARLRYQVSRDGAPVVEPSAAGIVVDGVNLAEGVARRGVKRSSTNQDYPTRGVHAVAHDRSNNLTLELRHSKSGTPFSIDVRAFNDGVGFRFVVPERPASPKPRSGEGGRTPDEATTFKVPPGSMTWTHDLHGHYEATYVKRVIDDVPTGDWAAPPVTYKLPRGGYAAITEAALTGYAGMALHADGKGSYVARLGHAHPASYPYALRYRAEDVLRLAVIAPVTGTIRTPWRVILASPDLNGLVNNDVITNLAPPPDPALFPQGPLTPWVKPGRAVWRYLDGGANTYDGLKTFTELGAKLGFEHHVVEGTWRQWTGAQLKQFVEHAKERNVGIWLWKHSRDLLTPEARKEFWNLCKVNGVTGAKIDFFDHEAKDVIDLYDAILREAAEHRLLLDFHGANKPTGMDRTWPNELTREAVWGFEHRGTAPWGPHNATIPFTRFIAGNGDYTPTVFGDRRRETSWPHQIATAIVFTSTLLVYGGHPQSLLDSPAVDIIKHVPATWDETIVLPPSEIGEIAVMARRSGRDWFIAAVNGAEPKTVRVSPAFLGQGRYAATIARDDAANAAAVTMDRETVTAADTLTFEVRAGGGFAVRLVPDGQR